MLSKYDLEWMNTNVQNTIKEWKTKIKIYSRSKTVDNYDDMMNEFIGDVIADIIEIDAERKDIYNNYADEHGNIVYGDRDDTTILYAIPNVLNQDLYKPSIFDLVTNGDGNVYYIRDIRTRIGELLLNLCKFVGNSPTIIDNEDNTATIKGYGWSND